MEFVDVLDEKGNMTGRTKTIAEVHQSGDWHRAVHVWFVNSRGELLLQLRSKNSFLAPDSWDISAAGHVTAGYGSIDAAIKETEEELGVILAPEQLELIGVLKESFSTETYINNEFNDVYLVKMDKDAKDFEFTDGEVQDVQWIPWRELRRWAMEAKPGLVPHPEEYNLLFQKLENLKP